MKKSAVLLVLCFLIATSDAYAQGSHTTHQVVKGETLYSISKKYHVSVSALEEANNMTSGNFKIKPGQKIKVPATASKSEPKSEHKTSDGKSKPGSVHTVTKEKKEIPEDAIPHPVSDRQESSDPVAGTTHKVVKGETVYSLSKLYGLTVKQIKEANHLPQDMKLKLGQKLIIPTPNPEAHYKPIPAPASHDVVRESPKPVEDKGIKTEKAATKQTGDENPFEVPRATTPKSEESGRDYLKSTPEPIRKDAVKSQPVETAKPAAIGALPHPAPVREAQKDSKDEIKSSSAGAIIPDIARPSEYSSVFSKYEGSGRRKTIYRGVGTFMQNENPGNQYLALYNYAEEGSILKVTNLMSKQSIYVKVVGKVPAGDAQNEVILKVSAEAGNQLKVSESKFLVEVTGYNQ